MECRTHRLPRKMPRPAKYPGNLKLLFPRKHTEDVLVFFSQLEINEKRMSDEEMKEEPFALFTFVL